MLLENGRGIKDKVQINNKKRLRFMSPDPVIDEIPDAD